MLILHYFRVALRNLQQFKVYSTLSVVCLAIGLLFFSMVYTFIRGEDKGIQNLSDVERRVVPVFEDADGYINFRGLSYADLSELEDLQLPGVEAIVGVGSSSYQEWYVSRDNGDEYLHQLRTCPLWGDLLSDCGARLYYGDRLPKRLDEVVLSASAARKLCGDESPIGLTMRLAYPAEGYGDRLYRVVNVVEDFDLGTLWYADVFRMVCEGDTESYTTSFLTLVPGCDVAQLADRIMKSPIGMRIEVNGETLKLWPLIQRFAPQRVETLIKSVVVLISALVLLSGFICFLMFIIHRFYNRQRELALRKMMGARPVSLSILLFAECFWVLTAALAVTLPLTEVAVDWVNGYSQTGLQMSIFRSVYAVMVTEVLVYVVLLAVCWFIARIPVWRLRYASVIHYVVRNRRRHAVRNIMLGVQLTISMFLTGLLAGLLVIIGVVNDKRISYFTPDEETHIVRIDFNNRMLRQRSRDIIAALQQQLHPVATVNTYGAYMTSSTVGGHPVMLSVVEVAPEYSAFFHLPLERLLADSAGVGGIYICRGLYERLVTAGEVHVNMGNGSFDVFGVYPTLNGEDVGGYDTKRNSNEYSVMLPVTDDEQVVTYYMRFSPMADDQMVNAIKRICSEVVPGSLQPEVRRMDKKGPEQMFLSFVLQVSLVLAVISLLLSAMGIYTAVSMDTNGRQKEMALRKIYGATSWGIARHFVRLYTVLLTVAFVVCVPLLMALFKVSLLGNDMYSALCSPWWLCLVLLIMGTCVLVSIFSKVRQIVCINPVDFIRTE